MDSDKEANTSNVSFGSSTAYDSGRINNIAAVYAKNVSFGGTPEPSKSSVGPFSVVPFPRDAKFVDRKDIFNKLIDGLTTTNWHQRMALFGLGGTGKSQIAIEFSYRVRDRAPDTYVFWINCDNRDNIDDSFRNIAGKLNLPLYDSTEKFESSVFDWLENERNGSWLLILDNADYSASFKRDGFDGKHRLLTEYIPPAAHGKVLVTSRDREVAFGLVHNYDNIVSVEKMDENQAVELLKAKSGFKDSDHAYALDLVKALDFLPLAITQAGSYLRQHDIISKSEYVSAVKRSFAKEDISSLNWEFEDFRRREHVPSALVATWKITFVHLKENYKDATDLLSLLAVYHCHRISAKFVIDTSHEANIHKFQRNASILRNYGLINFQDGNVISMHQLVQLVTKAAMRTEDTFENYRRVASSRLGQKTPEWHVSNELYWTIKNWRRDGVEWFLHVISLISIKSETAEEELSRARLLRGCAWIVLSSDTDAAIAYAKEASDIFHRYLQIGHPLLPESSGDQGLICYFSGKAVEARELLLSLCLAPLEHKSMQKRWQVWALALLACELRGKSYQQDKRNLSNLIAKFPRSSGELQPTFLLAQVFALVGYTLRSRMVDTLDDLQTTAPDLTSLNGNESTAKLITTIAFYYDIQGNRDIPAIIFRFAAGIHPNLNAARLGVYHYRENRVRSVMFNLFRIWFVFYSCISIPLFEDYLGLAASICLLLFFSYPFDGSTKNNVVALLLLILAGLTYFLHNCYRTWFTDQSK